jgi:hypothetical protein
MMWLIFDQLWGVSTVVAMKSDIHIQPTSQPAPKDRFILPPFGVAVVTLTQ